MKALPCRLGLRHHRPVREMTAAGPVYRCADCGVVEAGVLEMLDPDGEDGHVRVRRIDQVSRLHPTLWHGRRLWWA